MRFPEEPKFFYSLWMEPTSELSKKVEEDFLTSLQNFLWRIIGISVQDLFFRSSGQWDIFEENRNSELFLRVPDDELAFIGFDGIANAFPIETFSRHTSISRIHLEGEFSGNLLIQIWHSEHGNKNLIYEDPFKFRSGVWKSPSLSLHPGMGGRFFLSVKTKGPCSFKNLSWHSENPFSSPSFLAGFTIYRPEEVFFSLIQEISQYLPLTTVNLSVRIINQSGIDYRKKLPNDPRFKMIDQPNLGSTGGYMRGRWEAAGIADFYFGMTEDDLITHPEMLYRMAIIQSVAHSQVAIGCMMCDLNNPAVLIEQGTKIHINAGIGPRWDIIGNGADLRSEKTLDFLFSEKPCTYQGWWGIMTSTEHTPYLPSFFLHYNDMLQGVLMERNGIPCIVPPHLFIWQSMGENLIGWRAYEEVSNKIAFNFILDFPVDLKIVARWEYEKIFRCLQNFDYDLAEIYLMSFKNTIQSAKWTIEPEFIGRHLTLCSSLTPRFQDLSEKLSEDLNKRSFGDGLRKKLRIILFYLTGWGYLNPFAKDFDLNGKYVYRKQEVFQGWKYMGFKSIAVVDHQKRGYICKRSFKKMIPLLISTILTTATFLIFGNRIRKNYLSLSGEYEKSWTQFFKKLTAKEAPSLQDINEENFNQRKYH